MSLASQGSGVGPTSTWPRTARLILNTAPAWGWKPIHSCICGLSESRSSSTSASRGCCSPLMGERVVLRRLLWRGLRGLECCRRGLPAGSPPPRRSLSSSCCHGARGSYSRACSSRCSCGMARSVHTASQAPRQSLPTPMRVHGGGVRRRSCCSNSPRRHCWRRVRPSVGQRAR